MWKGILDKNGYREVEMTAEEIADKEARDEVESASFKQKRCRAAEKETLKTSAKAKLVAGEALTEEEANTIVI